MNESTQSTIRNRTYYLLEIIKITDSDTAICEISVIDYLLFSFIEQCHYENYYVCIIKRYKK